MAYVPILHNTSGHTNTYRPGVLVSPPRFDAEAPGPAAISIGAPFKGITIQRSSYTAHDVSRNEPRHEKEIQKAGLGADLLTRHGDFSQPRETYFATYNQLTFPAERHVNEPRTAAYTWSDRNQHNATVPHNTQSLKLTATKTAQQQQEQGQNPFDSTSRAAQLQAAVLSAEQPNKQSTLRLPTDGHDATIGRKPVGVHAQECDKAYRRTGLRSVYYPGNMA